MVFFLLWVSIRQKYFLISLLCLLIGWKLHGRFIQFSVDHKKLASESQHLTCMTYNLRWMHHVPPADQTKLDEKVNNLTSKVKEATSQLDLICLEEGTLGDKIGDQLGLPHTIKADKISIWLLSRHPILQHGTLGAESQRQRFALWADVKVNQDTVRVFALHLQSNKITNEAEELMEEIRFQEKETWVQMNDILTKYRKATAIRSDQARILRTYVEESPYPVIVCGDFNDTPQSNAYQVLSDGLCDSFVHAGKGIGTTYAGHLPALRIDYFLCSPSFKVKSHKVLDWDYSDHYPVIAEFYY